MKKSILYLLLALVALPALASPPDTTTKKARTYNNTWIKPGTAMMLSKTQHWTVDSLILDAIDSVQKNAGTATANGTAVTYTSAIPFNKGNSIMSHTVTGADTLTPYTATAVAGGGATLRIVADGVSGHEPLFLAPFVQSSGSDAYLNISGRVHRVYFDYDGTDYVYSIQQLYTIDITPPTIVSITATTATNIRVVMNEAVTATNVGWSFTKNGSPLSASGVSGSGTTTLDFTVGTVLGSDVLLASYNPATGNTLDASGNELATVTNHSVTNALAAVNLTFTTQTGLTNSSQHFTNTGGGAFTGKGLDVLVAPASTDVIVFLKNGNASFKDAMIGFNTANAYTAYTSGYALMWLSGLAINEIVNGTIDQTQTAVTCAQNEYAGMRRKANGQIWTVKSTDGITFTDVQNTGLTNTSQLYIVCVVNDDMYNPKAIGAQ